MAYVAGRANSDGTPVVLDLVQLHSLRRPTFEFFSAYCHGNSGSHPARLIGRAGPLLREDEP